MNQRIYREFRGMTDNMGTGELRTLEQELDTNDGFRKEAGREFSKAVHESRDKRVCESA